MEACRAQRRARRDSRRAPVLNLLLDLEESRVAGSGGCNRLTGTFALSETELRFGPLATTLMACLEPVMQRERAFLAALARVTSYQLDGGTLTLLPTGNPSSACLADRRVFATTAIVEMT